MVAVDDKSAIIVQIDTVDKGINQHLSVFLNSHVHATEAIEITLEMFLRDLGFRDLLVGNSDFQIFFSGFQFFQPGLGRLGEDTLLNRVQQIFDVPLHIPKLLFIQG